MPGPKMGPRPPDFDEALVRQSPTFQKWVALATGAKLRYACREFVKGHGDDEERLMRRIMIARRNNLKDHATLKKARATNSLDGPVFKKRKAVPGSTSDSSISKEMDVVAVEATRSYRKWQTLPDGAEFVYNQKYIKGKEGADWLLRKNIWRRMRYRRENKKLVETYKEQPVDEDDEAEEEEQGQVTAAAGIVDQALLASTKNAATEAAVAVSATNETEPAAVEATGEEDDSFVSKSVVEAAVAAAEQYAKTTESIEGIGAVHNPLEAAATDAALDAAARLAAAVGENDEEGEGTNIEVMQV